MVEHGLKFKTLMDILPESSPLKMLIIGKTPTLLSVDCGHYLQGKQGKSFWNKLKEYKLLIVPSDKYEDETLLRHGYGITDIIKVPRLYGDELSKEEYIENFPRIKNIIIKLHPKVLLFVYKGVIDEILHNIFGIETKSRYGFNDNLNHLFGSRVYAFPMPGTHCKYEEINLAMMELKDAIAMSGYNIRAIS
jgi:mismatch-specific thymine-DNA glycosylase